MLGAVILAAAWRRCRCRGPRERRRRRSARSADWPAAAGIAVPSPTASSTPGHRRCGQARATLTGIGTGLVFGISDALTRRTVQILDAHSFSGLLTSWPPYCLLAAALIAMWLMQNSFNAAPLHASLPGDHRRRAGRGNPARRCRLR